MNNLAILAEGTAGVSIFNVFDNLNPALNLFGQLIPINDPLGLIGGVTVAGSPLPRTH